MTPLQTYYDRYLPALEAEMQTIVAPGEPIADGLFGMLQYHLGWVDLSFEPRQAESGKRVRPMLCLLVCEACSGTWHQALPAAAAVELLHNFSLIHDDIEDGDRFRRGRPTLWAEWGEAQAINAGDTLFTLAELALLRLAGPSRTVLPAALELFNRTCLALTEGQYLDIGFEDRDAVPVDEYLAMIDRKTATLVACACQLGALIADGPDSEESARTRRRTHLSTFGRQLGLAFQMRDDVLGIWGDPEVTGKPAGADLVRRKKSLPVVHGLGQSPELRALLAHKTALSDEQVRRATDLLVGTGSRAYTEQLAREHHEQALAALESACLEKPAAPALRELARQLAGREH